MDEDTEVNVKDTEEYKEARRRVFNGDINFVFGLFSGAVIAILLQASIIGALAIALASFLLFWGLRHWNTMYDMKITRFFKKE